MQNEYYPFVNLPLPYKYDALESYIDTKTMMLHHDHHLQTYIDNLNAILRTHPWLQRLSLEQLIQNASSLPYDTQNILRNNAGGVYNHRFYFDGLQPSAGQQPVGALAAAINRDFGSIEQFKKDFQAEAQSVFGSGYAWLVGTCDKLYIITTPHQNSPIEAGLCPILTVDVWEHAYYLKHYNLRADYIIDWFHVVNWEQAEQNYQSCIKPCHRN